jgi:hypothetical protein
MSKDAEPITREKLTKRFLMGLPEGVYLVSNLFIQKDKPEFAENVSLQNERDEQWKRIVEARVNQRLCDVFKTKEDFENRRVGTFKHAGFERED